MSVRGPPNPCFEWPYGFKYLVYVNMEGKPSCRKGSGELVCCTCFFNCTFCGSEEYRTNIQRCKISYEKEYHKYTPSDINMDGMYTPSNMDCISREETINSLVCPKCLKVIQEEASLFEKCPEGLSVDKK